VRVEGVAASRRTRIAGTRPPAAAATEDMRLAEELKRKREGGARSTSCRRLGTATKSDESANRERCALPQFMGLERFSQVDAPDLDSGGNGRRFAIASKRSSPDFPPARCGGAEKCAAMQQIIKELEVRQGRGL